MKSTPVDKVLGMLLVGELMLLLATVSTATDPPPATCDQYCRMRRFFKQRQTDNKTYCFLMMSHTCTFCKTTSGACTYSVGDHNPHGPCDPLADDLWYGVADACDGLCPFPVQTGATYTAEAMEYEQVEHVKLFIKLQGTKVHNCPLVPPPPSKEGE
jgi:hypothetical protein